jgi:soluble lytic murein transglycosylase-like protein
MIEEVLPDEYPHVKATAPSAALASASAGDEDIHVLVETTAARYGIDVKLAQALVRVESNYYPRAVSPKGAKGLMQLMPSVAQQYAVSDVFNPAENLDAGMRHLRGLLDRFKDNVSFALAAYNAGLFAVTKYGGVPPYRETQDYVRRILALAR